MENEPVKRISAKSWKFSKDFLKNDVWGDYWKVRDLINNIKAPNLILKLLDRLITQSDCQNIWVQLFKGGGGGEGVSNG